MRNKLIPAVTSQRNGAAVSSHSDWLTGLLETLASKLNSHWLFKSEPSCRVVACWILTACASLTGAASVRVREGAARPGRGGPQDLGGAGPERRRHRGALRREERRAARQGLQTERCHGERWEGRDQRWVLLRVDSRWRWRCDWP